MRTLRPMDLLGKNLQWVQDIDHYFQNGFILIILDSHIEDIYPAITHRAYYTIHSINNITWRNCFQLKIPKMYNTSSSRVANCDKFSGVNFSPLHGCEGNRFQYCEVSVSQVDTHLSHTVIPLRMASLTWERLLFSQ